VPSPGPIPPVYNLEIFAYWHTTMAGAKAGITNAATRGAAIHDAAFTSTVTVNSTAPDATYAFAGVMFRVTESLSGHVHERIFLVHERPVVQPGPGNVRWCGGFEGSVVSKYSAPATQYFVWCPDGVSTGASEIKTPGTYSPYMAARNWGSAPELITLKDLWFGVFTMLPSTPIKANSFLFNTGGAAPEYYLVIADSPADPNKKKHKLTGTDVSAFCGFVNGTWYTYGAGMGPGGSTITTAQFVAIPAGGNIPYSGTWPGYA
jgi:hypothetical protein